MLPSSKWVHWKGYVSQKNEAKSWTIWRNEFKDHYSRDQLNYSVCQEATNLGIFVNSLELEGDLSVTGHRWGKATLSWTHGKMAWFSDFLSQQQRAHTRENPLQDSLVTFLTNELRTECLCPGISREDLGGGVGGVWKSTGCDRMEDVHSTDLRGRPRVLPTPVRRKQ